MSGWTPEELVRIGQADELDLASQRRDGSLRDPVTMWVVRDGDDLYVRSMHGRAGAWFRGTQTRRQGHIRSGGVEKDVTFVIDTNPALNDRIDAAYRNKYRRYGDRTSAVSSTLRHETQRSSLYRANYRTGALAWLRRKTVWF
jgi:hypothetical protein